MPVDALKLLRQLEPPIRPVATPGTERAARRPLEQQAFGELLQLVSRGEIHSGRPVGLAVEMDPPLDERQRRRLSAAADLAESEGAEQALLLLDGRGLLLSVGPRVVTEELTGASGGSTRRVDAAVYVADEDAET